MLCKKLLPLNRPCGPTSGGIARIWIFDGADVNFTQAAADEDTGAAAPYTAVTPMAGLSVAATAEAETAKKILSIDVTNGGTGYTSAPTVVFTGGGGTGAGATAVLTGDEVTSITVFAPGFDYATAPTISFTGGGGSGAAATATLTDYVSDITVVNGSTGYTSAPAVTISGGGGSGAAATATVAGGAVTAITVTNGGTGYTSAPTVTIAPPAVSGIMLPINFQREEAEYKFTQSRKGCSVKYEHSLEFLLPDLSHTITTWNASVDAAGCCCGIGLAIQFNSGKIFIAGERFVNGDAIDIPLYMQQDGSTGTSGKLLDDVNGETAILKGSYPRKLYEYTGGVQSLIDLQ